MSATIKEVARKAGVSIATVSRVLNNVGSVEEGTRIRVREAARSLRYTPSALARSLSTKRTDVIGLLLPDLYGEFFSEVIRGSDQTAQAHQYHLLVSSEHNDREEIEAAIQMMRGRVDGLVIMSPQIDAQTLRRNLPKSLPVVLLNCNVAGRSFESLNIDDYNGAREMVLHLLQHGHKRIAIIKGTEANFDAQERLRGYRAAVAEANAEQSERLELAGNFSEASGYDAVQRILALKQRPTAIFASNDSTAIGALRALRDAGVGVPGEIALAGFDDIPIASYLSPTLTSVHVGISNLGVLAIQNIIHAVREQDKHEKRQTLLSTKLSLRESCGCSNSHNINIWKERAKEVIAGGDSSD
jgi:LacI family transcriptional regulator